MIKIECDKCEKTFEVDNDKAGGKVSCPFCEDVNRVPEAKPEPLAEKPPAAMPAPDREEEQEICIVRPAMFRARPFRYLLNILLIVGGFVLAPWAKMSDSVPAWLMWPGLVIGLVALGWFLVWWLSAHFWIKLIVTSKRSIRQEGIIKRHTTEVLHDHIRSVDIKQNLLNRILKVGDIDIDSAGQASHGDESNIEISMNQIPRPYEVKKIIDQYRNI